MLHTPSRFASRIALAAFGFLAAAGTAAALPPNDDFDNATSIATIPFTDTVDVSDGSAAADDPSSACGFTPSVTIWYAFTPSATASIMATSSYVSSIHVLTGTRGALTEVACSNLSPPSTSVQFAAAVGVTYYIMVRVYTTPPVPAVVTFALSEPPPPPDNDEIDNARIIGALPFDDTVDTTGATGAPDDPFCVGQGATVWYSFTPTADVRIELNATSGVFTTTLSAYTGERGSLFQVACNAFGPGGPGSSRIRFEAQEGVTYHIMLGAAFQNNGGLATLSARVAPPPFTFGMTVDQKGSIAPATGVVTIRGIATCSQLAIVNASGVLRQDRPGQPIEAFVFTSFLCEGVTPWSATVSYGPRLFRGRAAALFVGGRAQAALSANAFVPFEGEFRSLSLAGDLLLTGPGNSNH